MDHTKIQQLVELLKELKKEGLHKGKRMPLDVWLAMHAIWPRPAIEVLLTDGRRFFLSFRRDKHWDGWQIPGGFIECGEAIKAAIERIARDEFGVDVVPIRLVTNYSWPDHPYGWPVSLVYACSFEGRPENGEFFSEVPSNMVPHHEDFIREFLSSR